MQLGSDIATCMHYSGIDRYSKQAVYVARQLCDRRMQRAPVQFFKPEYYFEVRKALELAGRQELIRSGSDALIPAQPPKEALPARREQAGGAVRGDYVPTVPNPTKAQGYRPGRNPARRRPRSARSP